MNDSETHSIILEFLTKSGFLETSKAYKNELTDHGMVLPDPPLIPPLSINVIESDENNVDREVFIRNFQNGNSQLFWKEWEKYVMPKNNDAYINNNNYDIQKLEFSLHLYFAVFSMIDNDISSPIESSMLEFKNYLETKGALLSQTPDFVAYYALPFVPNPKNHPTFKVIFEEEWRVKIKAELEGFLDTKTNKKDDSASETYLTWLIAKFNKEQENLLVKDKKRETELDAKVNVLTQNIKESEFRAKNCIYKLNKLKEDYHNLIGISAELVDSLEQCIRGKMVTPEYLVNICERLFKKSEKFELSKPGKTADIMRESLSSEHVLCSYLQDAREVDLNYVKIKSDLSGQCSDRKKGLLLQALIWRLLKSSQDDREKHISSFLYADIFGCKNNIIASHIKNIFESTDVIAAEYLARFINTVASFALGRIHLSQSKIFISYLVELMVEMEQDSLTNENLLGALQKLSLRKSVQDTLIELSVIEWLLKRLKAHLFSHLLSEYGLEYTVALLMNLCLRTIGKKRCVDKAENTLEILTNLLSYGSYDIKPYINGTLYSILALPSIRKVAIKTGLEATLNLYKDEDDQNNRQISFIVKQLYKDRDAFSDDDVESDEEEEEDEEGDAVETEMEKEESLFARENELGGETLLLNKYLVSQHMLSVNSSFTKKSSTKQKDEPLTRPVTPASKPIQEKKKNSPRLTTSEAEQVPPQSLMERPRTQSGKKNRNPPKEQASNKQLKKTYKEAFSSRPKVPRTPELSDSDGTIIIKSQTPPLTRSVSPTRPITGKGLTSNR